MGSSGPIGVIQVADEPDVSRPEVPRHCDSPGDGSAGIGLVEEPEESLDGSDYDASLGDLGDQNGVSDLGLKEDLGSLLGYLHAWREKCWPGGLPL